MKLQIALLQTECWSYSFELYTVCVTEAEGVTAVIQEELDDSAKSHGISRSTVNKMTEQMLEIWTNTAIERGTGANLSHY